MVQLKFEELTTHRWARLSPFHPTWHMIAGDSGRITGQRSVCGELISKDAQWLTNNTLHLVWQLCQKCTNQGDTYEINHHS